MFVPQRLKYIRIKKGFTQAELAQKVGIGVNSIARYENGQRVPNVDVINRIAKALEINRLIFYTETVKEKNFLQYDNPYEISKQLDAASDAMDKVLLDRSSNDSILDHVLNKFNKSIHLMPLEYDLLNSEGKEEANKYIKYLSTQRKYTAPDSSDAPEHEEDKK